MSEMEQCERVKVFRALQLKRLECLRGSLGSDSGEEDRILDDMDDAWQSCTDEEQSFLRAPGPYHEETTRWISQAGA